MLKLLLSLLLLSLSALSSAGTEISPAYQLSLDRGEVTQVEILYSADGGETWKTCPLSESAPDATATLCQLPKGTYLFRAVRQVGPVDIIPPRLPESSTSECGQKTACSQMRSCAEAQFHLTQCSLTSLDGDGDGVPCEALCR